MIVIEVIAILAAISIVAYNGIQARANDAVVKSDIRTLALKVREYQSVNGDNIPTPDEVGLTGLITVSKSAYLLRAQTSLLYCRTATESAFVAHSKSGNAFVMENGFTRSIGTWGGTNDDNACGSNAIVGVLFGTKSGYGYTNLFRYSTWQTWVSG